MGLFSLRGQGEIAVMNSPFDVFQQHPTSQSPVAGPSNQTANVRQSLRRNQPLARQQNLMLHQPVRRPSPLERVPTEIIPSPPPSPPPQLTRQQLMLQDYGIKARDFAYESTLPPVPTVKRIAPRPAETKALPPPRTVQRSFPIPAILDEEFKRRLQAKRRELMVSRVRMSNGEIRPGVVDYYDVESSINSGNGVQSQGRKVTPYLFGLSMQKPTDNTPRLEQLQESESQGSSQPQYESQSQGDDSSQPPLEPASQADSDLVETPLVTPSGSSACLVLETNTPPDSQQVSMPADSQDAVMEDVSESQMGIPESQSQVTSSDVEMDNTSSRPQSISPPSTAIRTTPSTSSSSSASGKKLLCSSPSRLFRRSSYSRASSRGLPSPTLKRKRGLSFEKEKRYQLRNRDATAPSIRSTTRPRNSLPATPSFQETPESPPQRGRRTPTKGGVAISRTASHTRAKGKAAFGTDASARPLRRSTRSRHSVGARLGS